MTLMRMVLTGQVVATSTYGMTIHRLVLILPIPVWCRLRKHNQISKGDREMADESIGKVKLPPVGQIGVVVRDIDIS